MFSKEYFSFLETERVAHYIVLASCYLLGSRMHEVVAGEKDGRSK